LPDLETLDHLLSVGLGCEAVASWAEVQRHGTVCREEPVGLSWRLERLHKPLALAGWLMRVFRAIIEIAMLAVFHSRQELSLGGPTAADNSEAFFMRGGDRQFMSYC